MNLENFWRNKAEPKETAGVNGEPFESLTEKFPKMRFFVIACVALAGFSGKTSVASAEEMSRANVEQYESESSNEELSTLPQSFVEGVRLARAVITRSKQEIPNGTIFSKTTSYEGLNGKPISSGDFGGLVPVASKGIYVTYFERSVSMSHQTNSGANVYEASNISIFAIPSEEMKSYSNSYLVSGLGSTRDEAILNALEQEVVRSNDSNDSIDFQNEAEDDTQRTQTNRQVSVSTKATRVLVSYEMIDSQVVDNSKTPLCTVTLQIKK